MQPENPIEETYEQFIKEFITAPVDRSKERLTRGEKSTLSRKEKAVRARRRKMIKQSKRKNR